MGKPPGSFNKRNLLALHRMDELGIEPIEMLMEVYRESMESYRKQRGYGEKSDAGVGYLGNALGAASKLASFRYPTLTAMAIKDMRELEDAAKATPMTTKEAIEIIKADPFNAPKGLIKDLEKPVNKDSLPLPIGVKDDK